MDQLNRSGDGAHALAEVYFDLLSDLLHHRNGVGPVHTSRGFLTNIFHGAAKEQPAALSRAECRIAMGEEIGQALVGDRLRIDKHPVTVKNDKAGPFAQNVIPEHVYFACFQ